MDRIKAKVLALHEEDNEKCEVSQKDLDNYGLTELKLREYQLVGVNWMLERIKNGHGFILGDEMGLGKTCQTISVIVSMGSLGMSEGPHLLISPLSILDNWKTELQRFAPHLKFLMYVGDKDSRAELRTKFKESYHILITTYEICLKDSEFLSKYDWNTLVVDEAHRLKNRESQLHQALLDFDIQNRILLTGTPIQNNLRELYSLLCFIAPKIFKFRYCDDFIETFGDVQEQSSASDLHDLLKPFILRRTKAQVVKDLPKRTEVILYHGITVLQKKFYKAILTKDSEVFATNQNAPRTRLMNVLMQLRKCVNHPYLFDGVEPEPFQLGEHLVDVSGKLTIVDQLLGYLKPLGHKVLIFSQMTHMLDVIQDYLGYRGYSYERLDGSVRGEERFLAIKNFNMDENTFIFLLSTKAGGVGLNLTSADTVIFVDSDFNPQNDLQAAARAHRIGQKRQVKIIRLIGRSTVEEIILKRAESKLKLTETVIEGDQFAQGASTSSTGASSIESTKLQDLLKFGVDKLLENDDSSLETVDFDAILGPTKDGKWTDVDKKESQTQASLASETMKTQEIEEEEGEDEEGNMYKYEGTDYSLQPSAADAKAIEKLIESHKEVEEQGDGEGPSLRKMKTTTIAGLLPTPVRQSRTPLTAEQIAERNKKRAETLARKAKEAEEEEKRRIERRLKRREALWEEHGYVSSNLDDADSDEDDLEEGVSNEDEEREERDIQYVSGDVTKPEYALEKDAIVVHCVDDSGSWGSGGLFTALSNRSSLIKEQYELAWEMRDIQLGDVQLIAIDNHNERLKGSDYVALIVSQHRDKRGNLSGIQMDPLRDGLKKIYTAAREKQAGVHLPRIGYATPGFNWYGTERLIKKHLASKKIPTYIYYYKRPQKQGTKRKNNSPVPSTSKDDDYYSGQEDNEPEPPKKKTMYDENKNHQRNSADIRKGILEGDLPDFMQGVVVYFLGVDSNMSSKLSRYLIAFDGDVHSDIEDDTTHLIVKEQLTENAKKEVKEITDAYPELRVVTQTWLLKCFRKMKKIDHQEFQLV